MRLTGDISGSTPRPTGGIHHLEMVLRTRLGAAAKYAKGEYREGLQGLRCSLSKLGPAHPKMATTNPCYPLLYI